MPRPIPRLAPVTMATRASPLADTADWCPPTPCVISRPPSDRMCWCLCALCAALCRRESSRGHHHVSHRLAGRQPREAGVDLVQRQRGGPQPVDRQPALPVELDVAGMSTRHAATHVAAAQHLLVQDHRGQLEREPFVRLREARGDGGSSPPRHRARELDGRRRTRRLGDVGSAIQGIDVEPRTGVGRVEGVGGAERLGRAPASSGRCRWRRCAVPDGERPQEGAKPTPPRPTTATVAPAGTLAVLTTAPTPVITAQPKIAATSGGTSGSIRTTELGTTTARSANAEIPL